MTETKLSRVPQRDSSFEPAFVAALSAYVKALGARVQWRRLGRVPGWHLKSGRLRELTDRVRVARAGSQAFLTPTPLHQEKLRELDAEDAHAAAVFRFACLCEAKPEAEVRALLGDAFQKALDTGVVAKVAGGLRARVSVLPFNDHVYTADSRAPSDDGAPIYVGAGSVLAIDYCRARLPAGKRRRALEIGTGTGMIVLELLQLYDQWEGGEYDPRSVAFSRANAELAGARNARFYQSDLFANVAGKFDMILFNPWQPSESCIDLIGRFVEQLPEHLEDDGHAVLMIESAVVDGVDPVQARILAALQKTGLAIERRIIGSYRGGGAKPTIRVLSALWFTRGGAGAGRITTATDLGAARAAMLKTLQRVTGR